MYRVVGLAVVDAEVQSGARGRVEREGNAVVWHAVHELTIEVQPQRTWSTVVEGCVFGCVRVFVCLGLTVNVVLGVLRHRG